jgi:hypothetical protein
LKNSQDPIDFDCAEYRIPGLFCAIGMGICFSGFSLLIRQANWYDELMYVAVACFSFAFGMGALRFPVASLLVAAGAALSSGAY